MNFKWTLSIIATLILGTIVSAQLTQAERARRSDEILAKARQVELMNQLLPLLLTPEQIEKLVPVIEQARKNVQEAEVKEYEVLLKLEPKLDAAITEGKDKKQIPSQTLLAEMKNTFNALNMSREILISQNVDMIMPVMKSTFNKGQLRAAIYAIKPQLFDPSLDPTKLDDDAKLRFFIKVIILDQHCAPVLNSLKEKK